MTSIVDALMNTEWKKLGFSSKGEVKYLANECEPFIGVTAENNKLYGEFFKVIRERYKSIEGEIAYDLTTYAVENDRRKQENKKAKEQAKEDEINRRAQEIVKQITTKKAEPIPEPEAEPIPEPEAEISDASSDISETIVGDTDYETTGVQANDQGFIQGN